MQILLIVPTFNYAKAYPCYLSNTDFPIGFPYLAAALKQAGHEVVGLNPNNDFEYDSAEQMLENKIRTFLSQNKPQLIGIGGLCTDFKFLKDAICHIRNFAPGVPIVCGGGIISNDDRFAFEALKPDYCIIGEGEEVLVQLVNALENGQTLFADIPNLGYWQNERPYFTKQNFNYDDIDRRPWPDYETFGIGDMIDQYAMAARQQYRYTRSNPRPMTIITARSCPFKCTFCVHQLGIKYRARAIEHVIAEIIALYQKYHFNILLILDELFANNKNRFKRFCEALIEARQANQMDFDWQFQTHASADLGHEELILAKQAGCTYFSYGIESASPKVLSSMNKKTSPDQIRDAIRVADEVQIGFGGNFIFGDIAETHETFFESMNFILDHCTDIHTNYGVVFPYPGSKLFEYCMEKGIIVEKSKYYEVLDNFIINMTAMPSEFWVPWIVKFGRIINQQTYLEATTAFSYENETDSVDHPMCGNGEFIWRIRAHCPHCHENINYREIFHFHNIDNNIAFFITGCPKCHKRIRVNVHANAGKRLIGAAAHSLEIFCDGRAEQPEALRQKIYDIFKTHINELIQSKQHHLNPISAGQSRTERYPDKNSQY